MFKVSSYLDEDAEERLNNERGYYRVFGALLFAAGISMLLLPILPGRAFVVLITTWLLFLCAILSVLRPMTYSRGVADVCMGLITAVYYAILSWASSGTDYNYIWGFRLILCVILIFAGFAKMLVFARLAPSVGLPLLLFCGLADVAVALLLFLGIPDSRTQTFYWFLGMLLVLGGLETLSEAYFLKSYTQKRRVQHDIINQ